MDWKRAVKSSSQHRTKAGFLYHHLHHSASSMARLRSSPVIHRHLSSAEVTNAHLKAIITVHILSALFPYWL